MEKKLYKNKETKMVSGVCSGLSVYFNMDVTLIRIIWALVTVFSFGTGIIAYIICAIIIPDAPEYIDSDCKENK